MLAGRYGNSHDFSLQKRHLIMQKPTTGLINGVAEQIIKYS